MPTKKIELIYLTSTLLTTQDGNWRVQKSTDRTTGLPLWVITRKEHGDRYKRVASAPDLPAATTFIEESENE